ncbi:MAG: YraN family protein [Clostridiales bacterium]
MEKQGKYSKAKADQRLLLGKKAEAMAVAWLEARGMRILERNFRCPLGEIDIIGEMGGVLVIVEVRSRSSAAWGTPAESVGRYKRQKLKRLAAYYRQCRGKENSPCRFDVLGLLVNEEGLGLSQIQWIADAF